MGKEQKQEGCGPLFSSDIQVLILIEVSKSGETKKKSMSYRYFYKCLKSLNDPTLCYIQNTVDKNM